MTSSRRLRSRYSLRAVLDERNWSYQDLSDRTQIPKGTIAKWCTGRKLDIPADRADLILAELNVAANVLFVEQVTTDRRENDTEQATTGGSAA